MRRSARVAVLALCAAVLPAAAGCSLIEQTVTQSVQDAVKQATGGDVELSDGVPTGFPSDEVPIVAGDVRGGTKGKGADTHWVVVVTGSVTADSAEDKLLAAGFTVHNAVAQQNVGSVATLSGAGFDVTLVGTDGSVVYAVSPRG
ncbi:hypothetical protein [Paramicrobacterium humi]|uniref:hypothetical protein n=1 Tax=Paramicrobacterium humi TaxID=640635 RepID=UPI00115F791D|nr:hypothetical protein [Microbacterium humi]